jgi:hypothetical protein
VLAHHDIHRNTHDWHGATAQLVPTATHPVECLWCFRLYRRGLAAEGWRLAGVADVGDESDTTQPACPYCPSRSHLRVSLRHRRTREAARLDLLVCRRCGHVEPQPAS